MKNEYKTKYKKKCKVRTITFYLNESELYEISKRINFQRFVKEQLKGLKEHG